MNFSEKVFKAVKRIPKGSVSTYSEIARLIGSPNASRAVGNALNKNPTQIIVPCHRVVRSDGSVGGFAKGSKKKIELLRKEGVIVNKNRIYLKQFVYRF